jgi:hypothetical protein
VVDGTDKKWGRFGHTTYAALFGGILGLGVLTTIPSVGFYALLAWGLVAARWHYVWPVFVAFGVTRALPLLLLAIAAQQRREYPARVLERFNRLATLAFSGDIALLTAIGVLFVLPERL